MNSPDQLRAVARRYRDRLELDRARLAKELHDDFIQKLTVMTLELSLLESRLAKKRVIRRRDAAPKLQELSGLVDEMITGLRRIKSEMRPKVLDEFGLVAALEWAAGEFQKRNGIQCQVDCSATGDLRIAPQIATEVYRICEEIFANIRQHAKARRVDVKVGNGQGGLFLSVSDDGRGIKKERLRARTSVGLAELRYRAEEIGGALHIGKGKVKGTRVTLRIPSQPEKKAVQAHAGSRRQPRV